MLHSLFLCMTMDTATTILWGEQMTDSSLDDLGSTQGTARRMASIEPLRERLVFVTYYSYGMLTYLVQTASVEAVLACFAGLRRKAAVHSADHTCRTSELANVKTKVQVTYE